MALGDLWRPLARGLLHPWPGLEVRTVPRGGPGRAKLSAVCRDEECLARQRAHLRHAWRRLFRTASVWRRRLDLRTRSGGLSCLPASGVLSRCSGRQGQARRLSLAHRSVPDTSRGRPGERPGGRCRKRRPRDTRPTRSLPPAVPHPARWGDAPLVRSALRVAARARRAEV